MAERSAEAPTSGTYDGPVPGPLTSSRRRARRGWGVGAVVLGLVGSLALVGCSTGTDAAGSGPAPAAPSAGLTGSAAGGPAGGPTAVATAVTTALQDLLRRRAAAVVQGDAAAFAGTVADPSGAGGRRQLASYDAARALRVSRLEVREPTVQLAAPASAGPATAAPRARAEVDLRYRVDDLDRADRVARLQYDLVRSGEGWRVVSERPVGPGATAPWVAMPTLRVERGRHGVVAGTVPAKRLTEHVGVVDRALPGLRARWDGAPDRVLVLAPSTRAEDDLLLGRTSSPGRSPVAASTEGPTDATGRATGDRVVLDPAAFERLTESGRDVVLTHELAHVAVRSTVAGRPAAWLAEGYADHVGYARADVPTHRLLGPLLTAVRTEHGPRALPTASEMQPTGGDIEVPYLAAWQAVELVADRYGEDALRRLVRAGASTGSDADAEAATNRALETVLGTTAARLTHDWLARLDRHATAG